MTSPTDKLNVLFIISDEHRPDVAGCYGNPIVKTPNIDRLAARGVRFENAYCQEPICGPSRTAVMTGTYPHTCNAFSHKPSCILPDMPTLGSAFRDAGYKTASIGKVHIRGEDKHSRDLGFEYRPLRFYTYNYKDYEDAVGSENVDRYASHRGNSTIVNAGKYNPDNEPVEMDESLMYDNMVADLAIDYIKENRDNPFFIWMGLEKPHPQWYAPERFHAMYDQADMPLPESHRLEHKNLPDSYMDRIANGGNSKLIQGYTEEQRRRCVAAYYANVSYMDMNLGRVVDTLDTLGLTEKTIVIYTADHGELLMDHSLFQKHCMFEAAVGVPLIMACPKSIPVGVVKSSIAELIDLFPTLLDMTGIPHPDTLEGHSLAKIIQDSEEDVDREAFSEYYPANAPAERMIRSGPWKYIYSHGDMAQLYNLEDDPQEMDNLAVKPEHAERCEAFKQRVFQGWEIDAFTYEGEG